ncbi:MAG: lytic transglycosylase domain-containing protein [Coriobacteriia bacterium]|nr:lytic transglycosylase domain-containing protein [Coriobacteriia bacterium]
MSRNFVRALLVGVAVGLAAITFFYVRGPAGWQRQYYPLDYRAQIVDSALRHSVNPYLVAAVINTESSWRPDANSYAGAVGLMQVMPQTAQDLADSDKVDAEKFPPGRLSDPTVNIEYGTAYLRYLVERYHEIEASLAAYNAGLRHADEWKKEGGDIRAAIDFPETKNYVVNVVRARERYGALYPDAFPSWTGSK